MTFDKVLESAAELSAIVSCLRMLYLFKNVENAEFHWHRWIFYNHYLEKIEKFLGGCGICKEFRSINQVQEIKDLAPYIRYLIEDDSIDCNMYEELNFSMFLESFDL